MTYVYKCEDCKKEYEVVMDIKTALSFKPVCPNCKSKKVFKKFFPTSFVMKGEKHYKNDNILS